MNAQEFRTIRHNEKLSLSDVARLTGYSKGHVANVESGKADASLQYTETFLRAVGHSHTGHVPTIKLMADLSTQAARSQQLQEEILDTTAKFKELSRTNGRMISQVLDIIRVVEISPGEEFNITEASPDEQLEISNYIISSTVELLKRYNFHKLETIDRKKIIANLIEAVAQELNE
jgi:transcriptional regulator with XRE-family HTH domain